MMMDAQTVNPESTRQHDELEEAAALREWVFVSTTPIVGRLIGWFREAWNSISAKWSVRALVNQQSRFNRLAVDRLHWIEFNSLENDRAIVNLHRRVVEAMYSALRLDEQTSTLRTDVEAQASALRSDVEAQTSALRTDLEEVKQGTLRRLDEVEARLARLERRSLEYASRDSASAHPSPEISIVQPAQSHGAESLDYYLFEFRFRGSLERVREAQRQHVQHFAGCQDVIDLGCGRGEFLDLLREEGIRACGVDLNPDMVSACQASGLDVIEANVLSWLDQQPDGSLGGVFSSQLIEHLRPEDLVRLVGLCYRKLKVGAPIVLETPNPMCLLAMATHFAIDPSHTRAVHPETLRFLLTAAGFGPSELVFSAPVPEEQHLKAVPAGEGSSLDSPALEILNENFSRLNDLLYGYQDYAIISRKVFWPEHGADEAAAFRQAVVNGH